MRNKLVDLNNHLFAQMERLGDESLTGDEFRQELERTHAMASVAEQIIANGKLALDATKLAHEFGAYREFSMPEMLGDGK